MAIGYALGVTISQVTALYTPELLLNPNLRGSWEGEALVCQRTRGLTIEEARRGCSGGGAAKRTWRLGFRCDGGSFVVVVVSLKTEEGLGDHEGNSDLTKHTYVNGGRSPVYSTDLGT
ncbi:hypothetical protein Rs2_17342 [Raphanus sativus]|nr:hypothetical protein Rs2_17342 [Raphanus sativus]